MGFGTIRQAIKDGSAVKPQHCIFCQKTFTTKRCGCPASARRPMSAKSETIRHAIQEASAIHAEFMINMDVIGATERVIYCSHCGFTPDACDCSPEIKRAEAIFAAKQEKDYDRLRCTPLDVEKLAEMAKKNDHLWVKYMDEEKIRKAKKEKADSERFGTIVGFVVFGILALIVLICIINRYEKYGSDGYQDVGKVSVIQPINV